MGTTDLHVGVRVAGLRASAGAAARALWDERSLVRVWCMRGTLHLLTPEQFALYASQFDPVAQYNAQWQRYFEVSADDLAALYDAIAEALADGDPLTRRELGAAVTSRAGERLGARLGSSWGELLKPAARRGLFVNGPPRGAETTYVRTDRWLPGFALLPPETAGPELLRRYLRAYGPAGAEDYARWLGVRQVGRVKAVLARLGEEVTGVSVGGRRLLALAADVAELCAEGGGAGVAGSGPVVRLLPAFDTYVLGHADRDHLVDPARRPQVYRTAGWISPTLLAGGRVVGTWEHRLESDRLEVRVTPFEDLTDGPTRAALEAEAERLATFFARPLSLYT
jgi:Winged helix DNA-binding domain